MAQGYFEPCSVSNILAVPGGFWYAAQFVFIQHDYEEALTSAQISTA